ncbi:helix-turn-helix domain-containing protein [Shewanella sp. SNU WT4]|nr:helix-turn-helix domain-containing protein [Shewanella sp. SNU WT4]
MSRTKTIYNQDYCSFIQCLCEERKRLGLSQIEVAQQLGMTQSEVSKIETAERRVDVFELKQLLKVYRVQHNERLKHFVVVFLGLDLNEQNFNK